MKLDIVMHYEVNEQTGEIKYIGKDEITLDTKVTKKTSSKKKEVIEDNTEPTVTLDSNKLILTQSAVDLLQVCEDCRIDIKYEAKNKKSVPIIGTDMAFGTKAGNLLSKKNTVSYRGAANTKLATYGTVFKLEPTENNGIYYLVGNKEEEKIEIPDELVDIEKELDLEDLSDLDDSNELGNFDYTL